MRLKQEGYHTLRPLEYRKNQITCRPCSSYADLEKVVEREVAMQSCLSTMLGRRP